MSSESETDMPAAVDEIEAGLQLRQHNKDLRSALILERAEAQILRAALQNICTNRRGRGMKTTIKAVSDQQVQIAFTDQLTGQDVSLDLSAYGGGGYVRDAKGQQICRSLAYSGSTLSWDGKQPLVDLIRREYRAMRRQERKFLETIG